MASVFNSTESFFGAVPSVTVSPALLGISAESGANVPFLWTSTAVLACSSLFSSTEHGVTAMATKSPRAPEVFLLWVGMMLISGGALTDCF